MSKLNKQQFRASRPSGGTELVIAGAGTGKTKTLVEKVKNTITSGGADPSEILILTFSRRAANEIRERVERETGISDSAITAGTFHSFCYRLIRYSRGSFLRNSGYSGIPEVITDEAKNKFLTNEISLIIDRFLGLPAKAVFDIFNKFDFLKQNSRDKLDAFGLSDEIRRLGERFNRFKIENNLIEYEDMIEVSIRMLESDDILRREILNRHKYIFVDEFQDTSDNNFRLIKSLVNPESGNLFAVGDDWQSIYGFRRANIDFILKFKKYFPGSVIHKLTVNYRSLNEIVNLSNRFIANNKNRSRKKLKSARGRGGSVKRFFCGNFIEEADLIQTIVIKEIESTDDIAILFRNNWQGRFLQSRLPDEIIDKVKMMTIHGSKGLEFDTVIIAGISDSIIPDKATDIEEERRLMYVALTRSKERLYVISHLNENKKPPRFFTEMFLEE